MKHKWLILSNLKEDPTKPAGFIQVSVNMAKENEKMEELLPETPEEELLGKSALSMKVSPNFKLAKTTIKVSIYYMHRLVAMDSSFLNGSNKSDPYIVARMGANEAQTEEIRDFKVGGVPFAVNKKLHVFYVSPSFIDKLTLSLMDWDKVGSNDYFGTTYISLEDIKAGKTKEPFWAYFYGGHSDVDNEDVKTAMNTYPSAASRFKGAVYMAIEEFSKLKYTSALEPLTKEEIIPLIRSTTKFVIFFRALTLTQLVYLDPKNTDSHSICIDWGGKQVKTTQKYLKESMATFWSFIRLSEAFYVRPMAFEESEENYTKEILPTLPDIIISVYNENRQKHVSYYKFRPEDFYDFSINQVSQAS